MNPQNKVDQKLLMCIVVRLCLVFKDVLKSTNVSDAVLSSLRGYSTYDDFYESLELFFNTFCKELEGLRDLKILTENLEAENKFNVTIQFNYSGLSGGEFSTNDYDPYPGTVSPDLRDAKKRIMISDDGELKWQPELKKRRFEEFSEVNVDEVQELMTKFDIEEDVSLKEYIVEFPLDKPVCVAEENQTLLNNKEHNAKHVDAENLSVKTPILHDPEMAEEAIMDQDLLENDDIRTALEEFSFEKDVNESTCSETKNSVKLTLHEPILFVHENTIVNNRQDVISEGEGKKQAPLSHGSEMDEETLMVQVTAGNEDIRMEDLTENPAVNKLEEPTSSPDLDYTNQFSDDEMERDFQQKLAEQNRMYEEKLADVRRKRMEKNEAAQKEIRAIEERIRRANH